MIRLIRRCLFFILPVCIYNHSLAQDQVPYKIGQTLEQKHYLHPQINDTFSADLWESYLQQLDPGKIFFLQNDIDALEKYKINLDDEIKGRSDFSFNREAIKRYKSRYEQAAGLWRAYLSKPVIIRGNDSIYPLQKYKTYAKNAEDQEKRWQQALYALYIEKYNNLQSEKKNSKASDPLHKLSEIRIQQIAREKVLKQKEQQLLRLKAKSNEILLTDYLNAITRNVDPHTNYFSYSDKESFDQGMSNKFYGIGVQLHEDEDGSIIVQDIDQAGPCWKNGLLSIGDVILGVGQNGDGKLTDIDGYGVVETSKLIRGKQGSLVQIKCRKSDGKVITAAIIREEIKAEESFASSALVEQNNRKIGYINLPLFYDDFSNSNGAHCADDVERELKKLMAGHIDGLVIDLRNNGGGSVSQVIKMTGLFIGSGPVVQVRDGYGRIQVLSSNRPEALYNGPLTVLVNELSASASEIFAAAIQDYKRGIIIGSQTLGKGTVQQTLNIGSEKEDAIKLTVQKFYRITGGSTQIRGVTPDVQLPDIYALSNFRETDRPKAMDWDRIEESDFKSADTKNLDIQIAGENQSVNAGKNWPSLGAKIDDLVAQKAGVEKGLTVRQYVKILDKRSVLNRQISSLTTLTSTDYLLMSGAKPGLDLKLKKDPYLKEAVNALLISAK